jgi:hypothetical protein
MDPRFPTLGSEWMQLKHKHFEMQHGNFILASPAAFLDKTLFLDDLVSTIAKCFNDCTSSFHIIALN